MATNDLHESTRTAFTLLELLAVLAVLGLLAAIAAPRLTGMHRRMALQTSIAQVVRLDQQARDLTGSSPSDVTIRINLSEDELWCNVDRQRGSNSALQLMRVAGIEKFMSARERKTAGVATVRFGRMGGSETYAVKLGSENQPGVWLLFAGLSGQVREFKTQREVEQILERLKQ